MTLPVFEPPIPPAGRPLTDDEREFLTAIVVAEYGPAIIERMTRSVWQTVSLLIEAWMREHDVDLDALPVAA